MYLKNKTYNIINIYHTSTHKKKQPHLDIEICLESFLKVLIKSFLINKYYKRWKIVWKVVILKIKCMKCGKKTFSFQSRNLNIHEIILSYAILLEFFPVTIGYYHAVWYRN